MKTDTLKRPTATDHQSRLAAWASKTVAEYIESHPDASLMDVRNALADAATDAVDLFPGAAE